MKSKSVSIQMKATEQYFLVVLSREDEGSSLGSVCHAVQGGPNFESVDEILKCDHTNESY